MKEDLRYLRVDSVVTADFDGQTVMMCLQSGAYFGLDEVGSAIWNALERPRSLDELLEELLREFEVERAACREETQAFLESLQAEGLIQARPATD